MFCLLRPKQLDRSYLLVGTTEAVLVPFCRTEDYGHGITIYVIHHFRTPLLAAVLCGALSPRFGSQPRGRARFPTCLAQL